jgi:membrane-bound lytic murein transglycosylase D
MSVRKLSLLFIAGTVISGCSSVALSDSHRASQTIWYNPTTWFTHTGDEDNAADPLESDQVTVAAGDEDLKKSVESGDEDLASQSARRCHQPGASGNGSGCPGEAGKSGPEQSG